MSTDPDRTAADRGVRARSFGAVAEDYDRLRPAPLADAVAWSLPPGARRVLDLAAGTGLMTRALLAAGVEVVAVEPDDAMRAVLLRRSPGVEALAGVGEAVPLPGASVDAVVVSSAWHWMDPARAVPEVARVLRDGGRFAAVWSGPDDEVPWVRALRPHDPARSGGDRRHRAVDLPPGSAFGEPETAGFALERATPVTDVVDLLGTYSQALVATAAEREAARDAARGVLREEFGPREPHDLVPLPLRAHCWRAQRLPR